MARTHYEPGFRGLIKNGYFWAGLSFLVMVGLALYIIVNYVVMPTYTRQNAGITVPDVRNMPVDQAEEALFRRNLRVERIVQRFNPKYPRDAVMEQSPAPQTIVKPNRRVFLTVNSGAAPTVTIPALEGLSLREATGRITALGLRVETTIADTIPSQFPNTITRQAPQPGETVAEGTGVMLWYSTGLGQAVVTVPDLTGMTVADAEQALADLKLQSVVVGGAADPAQLATEVVARQSREPGSAVREGTEIRLFIESETEEDAP